MTDKAQLEEKMWKAIEDDRTVMLGLDGRLGGHAPASMHFAAKGHEVFACLQGMLTADNDRDTIDRLWNKWVAAWFEGGKDDPKLQLLRFDPHHAQVWLNENSLFAGVKI